MKRVILYIDDISILGSDGLLHIDGRFNLESTKEYIRNRNKRVEKNLPKLVCNGFRFCDERLKEFGNIVKL